MEIPYTIRRPFPVLSQTSLPLTVSNMDLHHTISIMLTGVPTPATVRQLVEAFHRIAVVYLRRKARTGSLNPGLFGLPIEDLALDCIADLFCRDDNGRFVRLHEYFREIDVTSSAETDLLAMCRRLVFSRVNQDLYRQYREFDRPLHNIIRALKSASATTPGVSMDCEHDDWWLIFGPDNGDGPSHLLIPPEILEIHLTSFVANGPKLRQVLVSTSEMLREQSLYRRAFPLLGFGRILRSAHANLGESPDTLTEQQHTLSEDDIRKHILISTAEIRSAMYPTYVDKGKVGERHFDMYFKAISCILEADYLNDDGVNLSYYDHLVSHLGGISREEYQHEHRAYLEYLARLSRLSFLQNIRGEL